MTTPTDSYDGPEDRAPGDVAGRGTGADVVDTGQPGGGVGRADADADRARSFGVDVPDADGGTDDVPVGRADADEDARRAGADPSAP